MKRNRLLNFAVLLCNALKALAIGAVIALTVMLVHWHFAPGFYEFVTVNMPESGNNLSLETTNFVIPDLAFRIGRIADAYERANSSTVEIASIKPGAVYVLYLQSVAFIFVWILILKEIKRVVVSVQTLQTFRESNSRAFRKIGWYCFYIFLLLSFSWLRTDDIFFVGIYIKFTPLIFMLVSFMLSEIFEEGNKLYEEEQLTI